MKIWMRFGTGVAAIALSVGLGVGAYAMYGDDDAPKQRSAADAPVNGAEDASGGGGGLAATCLVGSEDCNDTPGIEYGDFGETSPKCAAEATDCVEPAACPPEDCSTTSYGSCELETAEDGSTVETCVTCTPAYPVPEPMIELAPGLTVIKPAPELDPADSGPAVEITDPPDFDPGMAGTGCLGQDPCAVSSRPLCVEGDCAVSSDGAVECLYIGPCDIQESLPSESEATPMVTDLPCAVGPCFGNDPVAGVPESCPSDPCTTYSAAQPEGVPCSDIEPCPMPDPDANAPESGAETCAPSTGGGSSGSSGSGSSSEGSATDAAPRVE